MQGCILGLASQRGGHPIPEPALERGQCLRHLVTVLLSLAGAPVRTASARDTKPPFSDGACAGPLFLDPGHTCDVDDKQGPPSYSPAFKPRIQTLPVPGPVTANSAEFCQASVSSSVGQAQSRQPCRAPYQASR